jgi:hypothetical protein
MLANALSCRKFAPLREHQAAAVPVMPASATTTHHSCKYAPFASDSPFTLAYSRPYRTSTVAQ